MEISWIKITTNIFDDEKVQLIESLPEGDTILVIWFKLLTLAGKSNNNGIFMIADKIPYTDEMLSTIFRRSLSVVRLALQTFQQFGMIEIIDGVVTLPNWNKHQNIESLDKVREQTRNRVANYRAKQKALIEGTTQNEEDVTLSNVTVTEQNKKENKNKNKNNIYTESEKETKTDSKHKYGEFKNVLLSETEYKKFVDEYGEEKTTGFINNFSQLKEMKGYKYKSDNLALRKWGIRAYEDSLNKNANFQRRSAFDVACNHIDSQHDYSKDAGEILENGELGF